MADSVQHHASTSFLDRLLALPPLNDALALTTNLYQSTKDYRGVGAVVGAAENSLRVAVTGVMPLATPILHNVGDWEALEKWACRGLDTVEQMAPIVTRPTSEVVEGVRGRVLGLLAGTSNHAAPPTLTTALFARVHNTVKLVSDSKSGRTAAGVTERVLNNAHSLLDYYLPPPDGELQESDGRAGGVVTKASTLAHKTRRRLYRTTHAVLHPRRPDCDASTPTQLVACAKEAVRKWYWTPRQESGEDQQTAAVARFLLAVALAACARLAASLQALLYQASSLGSRSAAKLADLRRDVAHKTRHLLHSFLHFTSFCLTVEDKILMFREWSDALRSALALWEQHGPWISTMY